MNIPSVSVQVAIRRGFKTISRPSLVLMVAPALLSVLSVLAGVSWWILLSIPAGIIASFVHTAFATARWRLWAYEHVADIHQFQRSAELAGLLPRKSHESMDGWMDAAEREKLSVLLQRFRQEQTFNDDSSVPEETIVHNVGILHFSNSQSFALNTEGIVLSEHGTAEWETVENERITHRTAARWNEFGGSQLTLGGSTRDFFRFECAGYRYEFAIASLGIATWELDLLLYIYRGRYVARQAGVAAGSATKQHSEKVKS